MKSGKWHEAIELILKPRQGEHDKELAEARQIYAETKDAHAAYAKIKRVDKIEARLLKGLQVHGNTNPVGALDSIPRNTRLMYIHAYQSFVWNHIVSQRIKQFGTDVIVGDLVYDKQKGKEDVTIETTECSEDNTNDDKDDEEENTNDAKDNKDNTNDDKDNKEDNTNNDKDNKKDNTKDENDITSSEEKITDSNADKGTEEKSESTKESGNLTEEHEDAYNLPVVKILAEEDLPNYTLADVIMPQPGWKVTYPPYAKPWFDEFLSKDGLTTDLKQKNK